MSINPALLSSNNQTFNTPVNFLELVKRLGEIGLDPCSNPHSLVGARRSLSLENGDNGLTEAWDDQGLVFVNPPYGRSIPAWVDKACDTWVNARGSARDFECIMLIPARTDTRWFSKLLSGASALAFWRGRLTFLGASDPAPFPSLVVYFGEWVDLFARVFEPKAHVWRLP